MAVDTVLAQATEVVTEAVTATVAAMEASTGMAMVMAGTDQAGGTATVGTPMEIPMAVGMARTAIPITGGS